MGLYTSELMTVARKMYPKMGFQQDKELPSILGLRYDSPIQMLGRIGAWDSSLFGRYSSKYRSRNCDKFISSKIAKSETSFK